MSIDFKVKDFFYPLSILSFHKFLGKSQWFSKECLKEYQSARLEVIINHAYDNVPYYRRLFQRLGLKPKDFKGPDDLRKLPLLTKDIIRREFDSLKAHNTGRYHPRACRTSGTTGQPVQFYLDKNARVLEFCYYWRYFSWAGYSLGTPFAELTLHHFLNGNFREKTEYDPLTRRLSLNPSQLSQANCRHFALRLGEKNIRFLKGSPSSVYLFALLVEQEPSLEVALEAVFTTGELLLDYQREKIKSVFQCRVFDSYGHMERTVAISQCEKGTYHIHPEYGLLEALEGKNGNTDGQAMRRIVGTSLYNMAMPLIRYETHDLVELEGKAHHCPCGRRFPAVKRIVGREQDILMTSDGRILSNVFILLDMLQGVQWAQIVQEKRDRVKVRIIKGDDFSFESELRFLGHLNKIIGNHTDITTEYLPKTEFKRLSVEKYKPVVSRINDAAPLRKDTQNAGSKHTV